MDGQESCKFCKLQDSQLQVCMILFGPWFYYLFWHIFARMMATFNFEICTEFINIWCAAQYAGLHMSINSLRMLVMLQSMLHQTWHLASQLFYWSGAQEIVFSSSATWRRYFGNIKIGFLQVCLLFLNPRTGYTSLWISAELADR